MQNYTNMVVGELRIQTLQVAVAVLLLLSPQMHIPYYFWTSDLSKYIKMSKIWAESQIQVFPIPTGYMAMYIFHIFPFIIL